MKKISLKGISESLSARELKNILGGCDATTTGCENKKIGDDCVKPSSQQRGCCAAAPFAGIICKTPC